MKKLISVLAIITVLCMGFSMVAYGGNAYPILPINDSTSNGLTDVPTDYDTSDVEIISIKDCNIGKIKNATYTGKALKPSVTVKYNGKTLKKNKDYTLSYKDNKKIGKATVTIKGKGNYTGSVKKTFKIVPKGTKLTKVTSPKSRQLKAVWKKQSVQTTGYQLQYSTSSKFAKAKVVTVNGAKKTSALVNKLTKGKKYYVRVRTYKTVGKTKYASSWSKPLNIKIK